MDSADARAFTAIASCFASVTQQEWQDVISKSSWEEFLDTVRSLLEGKRQLGLSAAPIGAVGRQTPFSEFLSDAEVDALFHPPSFEGKRAFAARHFTGGLPASAVPVESLHRPWAEEGADAGEFGLYRSDVASYMRDLIGQLGLKFPEMLQAHPDHLSVELGVVAHLLDAGLVDEARLFARERFDWLGSYRATLLGFGEETTFYIALVDVLIGIHASLLSAQLAAVSVEA